MAVAVEYAAHGRLAPYLSKLPGLFGFYADDRAWAGDVAECFSSGEYILCDALSGNHKKERSSDPFLKLLPPFDFEISASITHRHVYWEDLVSGTPAATPSTSDSHARDQGPLSALTPLLRRDAVKISRRSRDHLKADEASRSLLPENANLSGIDKLLTQLKCTLDAIISSESLTSAQSLRTLSSELRHRLNSLRDYKDVEVTELLVTDSYERFDGSTRQIFPNVRPMGNPLSSNPPIGLSSSHSGLSPAEQAYAYVRPLTSKYRLAESLCRDLIALLTASRYVRYLFEILDKAASKAVRASPSTTSSSQQGILGRSLTMKSMARALDNEVDALVASSGLKAYQFTIIKKKLEGIGYLPVLG